MKRARRRSALGVPVLGRLEPDLSGPHKRAILASLRWAWAELSLTQPGVVGTEDEEAITEGLERLLNAYEGGIRRARWLESFHAVTRGSKVRTADGRIEKQPDLHFRPIPYRAVRCASDWAWFVECKIIDGNASLRLYREQGIERFRTAEYAACMPSAAMVGYCRDGSAPLRVLSIELEGRHDTQRVVAGPTVDVCGSSHLRRRSPGEVIELTHLWLAP